jgi:hypothetical protein
MNIVGTGESLHCLLHLFGQGMSRYYIGNNMSTFCKDRLYLSDNQPTFTCTPRRNKICCNW